MIERREFIKATAAATGSFIVGFHFGSAGLKKAFASAGPKTDLLPQAFIQIAPDSSITLVMNHLEMGQGVNTSMAQLIAEELECDWRKIKSVSAPVAAVYNSPMGMQMTGGSTSLASTFDSYRKVGASMRETLIRAASQKWGVNPSECRAENGSVIHSVKGAIPYGELAQTASELPLIENVKLKKPKDFKVIGQSLQRVDAEDKSTGRAIFGIDVKIPGMLDAMLVRPPLPGAKLISFEEAPVRAMKGIVDVVRLGDSVAVLGKNTYFARIGRDALKPKWDFQGKNNFNDESLMKAFKEQADAPGITVDQRGDAEEGLKSAVHKIRAEFEFPYLAHAPMEPMNCTIHFDGRQAELWSGHQMPTMDRDVAAGILGIPPEKVQIHTVYAGGSFGRRASKVSDYVVEAALLAKIVKKPIKITWTREDDMRGGYYRPMNFHRVEIGFDSARRLVGWSHRIVGQSVVGGSPLEKRIVKNGIESTIVEGVAGTKYGIPHFKCDLQRPQTDVTTLWWRSVGHTHTAYVMEVLIDEIAHWMKKDALALRKEMLAHAPKHLAVLGLLEKTSPWGKIPPPGHAYGLAVHESFNSVVGQVVQVSCDQGKIRVHRVWSAVHCGQVVNPEGAKTQVEGAFIYGLSAALHGKIVFKNGEVETSNFHNYQVVRMPEAPIFETHFVQTEEHPTGLGEPGLPPAAPAIANALFKLTGKRMRKLPWIQT